MFCTLTVRITRKNATFEMFLLITNGTSSRLNFYQSLLLSDFVRKNVFEVTSVPLCKGSSSYRSFNLPVSKTIYYLNSDTKDINFPLIQRKRRF